MAILRGRFRQPLVPVDLVYASQKRKWLGLVQCLFWGRRYILLGLCELDGVISHVVQDCLSDLARPPLTKTLHRVYTMQTAA